MSDLTREELRSILTYDLNTGIFRWNKTVTGYVKKGYEAGYLKSNGYVNIKINYKDYKAHQLAFLYVLGYIPEEIDHENHITFDNRWINIFPSNRTDNCRNKPMYANNTSGFTGVTLYKKTGQWQANIRINGKQKYLGRFDDINDAIEARKQANIKYGFHKNHGKPISDYEASKEYTSQEGV